MERRNIYNYLCTKQVHLKVSNDKTPYELWFGRPYSVKYFRVFGSKYYIKREDDNLGKLDSRTDDCIFLGYYSTKMAYRCYNLKSHKIVESASVTIDDTKSRRIQIQESEDVEENDDEEIDDKKRRKFTRGEFS